MDFNVDGITVHPRPDARHIRWSDIEMLKQIMKNYHGELNIEGYPTDDFSPLSVIYNQSSVHSSRCT